jgi:membrane protein YdbS with pleckstrin-like domain
MPKLYPEDQARVDQVLSEGIYKVERKPFRFWGLMAILISMLVLITVIGYLLGVYYDKT